MVMHLEQALVDSSRHKCLIYDGDPSEQLPVVVPLLADGLEDNWRCLYLGSPEAVHMVESALNKGGIDTAHEAKRGALFLSSDRGHLRDGVFEPNAMIDGLCASIDDAVREGFAGLCATGDMRWELGADTNFERLLEYEALLEQLFRDKPLRGICQYHRDIIPAQAVRDALMTHQAAYVGDVLNRDNLFYIPPEVLLETRNGSTTSTPGEWMCQQILRVLDAERKRDHALTALRASEAEQRRLAEQLAEMNRGLEQLVAERTAELRVANRHLEAFSYSVSHDLRAPLRSILGFSNMLIEDFAQTLGEEARRHLDRVCTSARRMESLIEALLAMGRVVNAQMHRTPVDLTALADELSREIRETEPNRSADIAVHRGLRALGDPTLLRAVLTNLLTNAWKFTSKRTQTRIEVGRRGEEAGKPVFYVRDNGAGFDMAYAQRLFGVFQRLHRQDEFPGTGVGLATVERIISRHGGRIWAESRADEGATFLFTLPAEDSAP